MTTRYLTLAYGDSADVYSQSAMLLVSLLAHAPAPCELVVVTDRPERFAWFGRAVRLATIDRHELEAWRGTPPISMRVKLEAIRANWPGSGAIALVDADVLAREPLDSFEARLGSGEVFMHKQEYEFGRSRRRGNRTLWSELRGRSFGGWEVRSGDAMWNSGVLAAPAADRPLFDQMLEFYDALPPPVEGILRPSSWSRASSWAGPAACVPLRGGSRTTGETRRRTPRRSTPGSTQPASKACRLKSAPRATGRIPSISRTKCG